MFVFFFGFEKQVKRIMSLTYELEEESSYRVWSLTRQGFLKLTTKNGHKGVECSWTGEESSSKTEMLIIVLLWVSNFL